MSNDNTAIQHGLINFAQIAKLDKATIRYTVIPYGYLAQDINNENKIFMFKTFSDMEYYFTDHTKSKY